MQVMLDTSRMAASREGIENFYWPLAHAELATFRDELFAGLANVARARGDELDLERDLFGSICHFLTKEGMSLFLVHALVRRIRAGGHEPVWPANAKVFPALAKGRAPEPADSQLVQTLKKGPVCHATWKRPLVKLHHNVALNGFSWRALRPSNPTRDIVAVHLTDVLQEHARSVPDAVEYAVFGEWFAPISDGDLAREAPEPLHERVRGEAVQAVAKAFKEGGEELAPYLAAYLDATLAAGSRLARQYLERIGRYPEKLPRRLWTGSGGYLWARLLRHAVRRQGGEVTGHEHGTGEGLIAYFNSKTFMDLESADRFVTFNSNQCRWLRETLDPRYLVPRQAPEITIPTYRSGLVKYAGDALLRHGKTPTAKGPLRIMYVGSIYCSERPRAGHHNADLVIADWQARLFGQLKEWCYEVVFKPHPEGEQRPPASFVEKMGIRFIEGRFEAVWEQADVLLFDWKSTSAFCSAINTDRPIILFDFNFERFVPEARELVERRCNVIPGWQDADNRLQIDWEQLRSALESPIKGIDDEFLETALRFA